LDALLVRETIDGERAFRSPFGFLKTDAGVPNLDGILEEIEKLKHIRSRQRLYLPLKEMSGVYANLQPVLTRPIRWHLIEQQYDEMVKFATALRLGTAETEAILRRFTRKGPQHPTYKALAELGKAVNRLKICWHPWNSNSSFC
jgi:hypothetical protein